MCIFNCSEYSFDILILFGVPRSCVIGVGDGVVHKHYLIGLVIITIIILRLVPMTIITTVACSSSCCCFSDGKNGNRKKKCFVVHRVQNFYVEREEGKQRR